MRLALEMPRPLAGETKQMKRLIALSLFLAASSVAVLQPLMAQVVVVTHHRRHHRRHHQAVVVVRH
jgi:hypothetical protein